MTHVRTRFAVAMAVAMAMGGLLSPSATAGVRPATPPGLADQLKDERPTSAEVKAEIDRVVEEGTSGAGLSRAQFTKAKLPEQVASAVRCAEFFDSARYCLNYGWTIDAENEVVEELQESVELAGRRAARTEVVEETGDLSLESILERAGAMPPAQRAQIERKELVDAAAGIDTFIAMQELRESEFEFVPVSEAPSQGLVASRKFKIGGYSYPESGAILKDRVAEQETTYWCGPTTIQMMAWNYGDHKKVAQSTWASRLGTTTSGTGITNMVALVNKNPQLGEWTIHTDQTYITLSIANHTYAQWYSLNVNHYSTWTAPVILHPVLLKSYFPYLDDNGSGHFQLGRGWDAESHKTDSWQIKYYEPWNQRRFDPSEPSIARKQKRWAKNSYLANRAHFQQNIGV